MEHAIPSLKELCVKALVNSEPKTLNRQPNLLLSPEIKSLYFKQELEQKKEMVDKDIQVAKSNRHDRVNAQASALAENKIFFKSMCCAGGSLLTILYLGIGYPILRATETSTNNEYLYYSLGILPFVMGAGLSTAFLMKLAKLFAELRVPKDSLPELEAQSSLYKDLLKKI
ncbi:hypothetical protein [Legionella jordanis]|uniref:Transmembrane protein n=1 Tax=Legionella jordanis TaxID=456 RepID=A0A0W0VCM1_9GAMM|nr:hypothetical protein [Legionella jordanis]KTD17850.1 hypothetical protein Ljor_2156 [Legionella jordanis]RMX02451.1 hypothetical protein EAW55_09385 [Legionella jordanis]VEH11213.1 Uncharacterised protein [Legionella jordanis]HAT8713819.1 hypothetical protein [Legionella jordanis]